MKSDDPPDEGTHDGESDRAKAIAQCIIDLDRKVKSMERDERVNVYIHPEIHCGKLNLKS